ncbi:hypothetical protein [Euryhalocaulis caribicus]|uniref:hypothetical protein n=1 Tax=Euryhalocaulis caribicus TaxID=1161401 RepID=UPI00039F2461|nr:hypothetical protein [Euryhalocaulis caribicus]
MFARYFAAAALLVFAAVPAWAGNDPLNETYQSMSNAGAALRADAEAVQTGDSSAEALLTRLSDFAQTASAAGAAIDANEGPHDLGCIYRGMAADAALQADRLRGGEKDDAIETVRLLGDDAVLVTPETEAETQDPTGMPMGSCPVEKMSADQLSAYFTEQP